MRAVKRNRGKTREELIDLLRLGGLALELDGFMWLRVALSWIRTRLPGRLGALALVLAIALRFLPFFGAAVCGVEVDRARVARAPAAHVRVEPLRPPAEHPDAREPGARMAPEPAAVRRDPLAGGDRLEARPAAAARRTGLTGFSPGFASAGTDTGRR